MGPSASFRQADARGPLSCHVCAVSLSVERAWARDGDVYCDACRPPRATSGAKLPRDPRLIRGIDDEVVLEGRQNFDTMLVRLFRLFKKLR
ncbi:hypothetical protein P2318_17365 [Myxococcaceae bacterium GXIMD 01537]